MVTVMVLFLLLRSAAAPLCMELPFSATTPVLTHHCWPRITVELALARPLGVITGTTIDRTASPLLLNNSHNSSTHATIRSLA
uniref:Putative secreted protein n=1 Tax=Anopheles darlingi TaxID=43151 RepID=A0A2M4DN99_ANODA